ncbi:hypothetical protein C8J56DRAFT_889458 [Mycena floridula]|nr:hypothetical protein C8J56DRAFT_889458 [Mycena floridula]
MAAPSHNNIYSTGIAAGSVDFYDERYTEVRASLANEVAFFAKVKPNPFWLLKEVSYWLATWNGFMTTYLFFPNVPSEAFNEAEVQEQQDDWRIRASFDTMSRAFDDWRNCCCRTPNSLPASWTKIDGRCNDILDHGFPAVVTSTEDTRLRLSSYCSLFQETKRTVDRQDSVFWKGENLNTRCQIILDAAVSHLASWYATCEPPSNQDHFFRRSFPSLRACGDILHAGLPSNYDLSVKQWPKAIFLARLEEFYSAMSDAALSGPLSVLLAGFSSPLPFDSLIPKILWPWRLPDKTISHFETSEALMILRHSGFQLPPNFETWSAIELSILPTWMLPQSLPAIPAALPFRPLDRILSPDRKEHPLFGRSTFVSPTSPIAESDPSPVKIVASPDILPAAPTFAALAGSSTLFNPAHHGSVQSSNIADVVADGPSPHPEPLFLPRTPEPDSPDFVDQSRDSSPIPTSGLGSSSLPIAETNTPAPLRRSTRGKKSAQPSAAAAAPVSAASQVVIADVSMIVSAVPSVSPGRVLGDITSKTSKTRKPSSQQTSAFFPLPAYSAGTVFGAVVSMPFNCGRYVSISRKTHQPAKPKVENPVRKYPTKCLHQPISLDMLRRVPRRFQGNPPIPVEAFCACFDFSVVLFPKTRCLLPADLEPAESLDITWEIQAALKANKVLVSENRPKLKSPYDRPSYNFSSTSLPSQLPATVSSSSNAVPSLPQASSNLDEVPVISETSNMGLEASVHPPLNPALVDAPSAGPSSTQGWFIPTGLLSDVDDIISPTSAPAADVVMLDVGFWDNSMGTNVGLSKDVGMSDYIEMPAVDRDNKHLVDGEETSAFVEEVREVEMLPPEDLLDLPGDDDDMEIDELLPSETGTPMVRELSLPPVATLDALISLPLAIPIPQPATTSFLLRPAQFTPFSDDEIPTTFARPPSSSSNSSIPEQWHSTFASPVASVGGLSSPLLLDATEIDQRLALAGLDSGAEGLIRFLSDPRGAPFALSKFNCPPSSLSLSFWICLFVPKGCHLLVVDRL